MKLDQAHNLFFVGIGGIGMSALARYFKSFGKTVSGYDKTESFITGQLTAEGMEVVFTDAKDQLPQFTDAVIYTPAVKESALISTAKERGIPVWKRSEVLGWISKKYHSIAVAGTHGKTTTAAILSHLFHHSMHGVNAFVGGTMSNYNTNYLCDLGSDKAVVEADEFDRSFLTLFPNYAVITSMDADHLDVYGKGDEVIEGFNAFAQQVEETGALLLNSKLQLKTPVKTKVYTYSLDDETADFYGDNVQINQGVYHFDLRLLNGEWLRGLQVGLQGRHNVENAIAASAIAYLNGLSSDEIKANLVTFRGVKRRFEYIIHNSDFVFIDDYAHHPKELTVTIQSAKELFPGKRVTGVFQPHLYSRTRDFEDDFAQALSLLDELILLDIYPAREKPIEGVTSAALLDKVALKEKRLLPKKELVEHLKNRELEVLMTLGAGDIDKEVEPIKNALLK